MAMVVLTRWALDEESDRACKVATACVDYKIAPTPGKPMERDIEIYGYAHLFALNL
jgi:hypothetical protein